MMSTAEPAIPTLCSSLCSTEASTVAQVSNTVAAGAAAAVIINADDADLQGGAHAQVPSARISASSGAAVSKRAQREPGLVVTLAVPEGADICQAQQSMCEQPREGTEEGGLGGKPQGFGLEVVLTPQVTPLLGSKLQS